MKKTIIALIALASVATVSAETLTLSSSAVNVSGGTNSDYTVDSIAKTADLKKGNICLTWGGTDADEMLTSWKLSFTLTDGTIITDNADATKRYSYLFGTITEGAGGASGYTLRVNSAGALEFSNITTDNGTIQAGVATDITLSFIANEKLNTQTNNSVLTGGTFTLTVGEDSWSETVLFDTTQNGTLGSLANYHTSILNGKQSYSYEKTDDGGNTTTHTNNFSSNLWTNGGEETFSNIKLEKLSNNVLSIPEPTTATLSLLALAGLAARRRRR